MSPVTTKSQPLNAVRWFDVRGRKLGAWAFALNRLTGLGLAFYLFLHLIVLGQLAQGPGAYDNFLALIHNPIFILGELLVVIAGLIHGLNGVRIALTSFGIAVPYQKQLFSALMLIAVVGSLIFAVRMLTA